MEDEKLKEHNSTPHFSLLMRDFRCGTSLRQDFG